MCGAFWLLHTSNVSRIMTMHAYNHTMFVQCIVFCIVRCERLLHKTMPTSHLHNVICYVLILECNTKCTLCACTVDFVQCIGTGESLLPSSLTTSDRQWMCGCNFNRRDGKHTVYHLSCADFILVCLMPLFVSRTKNDFQFTKTIPARLRLNWAQAPTRLFSTALSIRNGIPASEWQKNNFELKLK